MPRRSPLGNARRMLTRDRVLDLLRRHRDGQLDDVELVFLETVGAKADDAVLDLRAITAALVPLADSAVERAIDELVVRGEVRLVASVSEIALALPELAEAAS